MYINCSVQVQAFILDFEFGGGGWGGEGESGTGGGGGRGLGDDPQEMFGILGPSRLLLMQVKSGGGREEKLDRTLKCIRSSPV